jgi:hypothetical protein
MFRVVSTHNEVRDVGMYLIAPVVSLLPQRWRNSLASSPSIAWVPATIVSGCVEALCGLIGLVYWYSYSVTGWAEKSLTSGSVAHPGTAMTPETEGFIGLLLVAAHPLTWVIVAISLEGIARVCTAAFTGEILGTFPLFIADKIFALFIGREKTAKDSGNASRTGDSSFFGALRQRYLIGRLPLVPDELHFTGRDSEQILEIRACRPKLEWDPPRVVRYGDDYFCLESAGQTSGSRPFLYALRRLASGVPGRTVLEDLATFSTTNALRTGWQAR